VRVLQYIGPGPCDLDRSIINDNAAFHGPFPLGHAFGAGVASVCEGVSTVEVGELVVVPAQISCGVCASCRSGDTAFCRGVPPNSMCGLGPGAAVGVVPFPIGFVCLTRTQCSSTCRAGVAPMLVAAASDNLTNAYEAIVPHLMERPDASVPIAGVGSTGLYGVLMARAHMVDEVDYLDHDAGRLALAERPGARIFPLDRHQGVAALDRAFDVSLAARGVPRDFGLLLRSLAHRGVCTCVSMYFRDVPLPCLDMFLEGVRLEVTPTNVRRHLRAVLQLLATNRIDPSQISEVFPWEVAAEALAEPSIKPVFVRDHECRGEAAPDFQALSAASDAPLSGSRSRLFAAVGIFRRGGIWSDRID